MAEDRREERSPTLGELSHLDDKEVAHLVQALAGGADACNRMRPLSRAGAMLGMLLREAQGELARRRKAP